MLECLIAFRAIDIYRLAHFYKQVLVVGSKRDGFFVFNFSVDRISALGLAAGVTCTWLLVL